MLQDALKYQQTSGLIQHSPSYTSYSSLNRGLIIYLLQVPPVFTRSPHALNLKALQGMFFFTPFGKETKLKEHGVERICKDNIPSSLQNKVGNFFKMKQR